jgi:hypothetical protein
VKISPLTKENISLVIEDPAEVCAREAALFDITRDMLKEKFFELMNSPFSGAFFHEDATCCAIIAMEIIGVCRWRSHFAAAEGGLKKIGRELTQFLTQISDSMVRENSGKGYIEVLSAYGEGKVREWFESMGFKLIESEGVVNKYIKEAR